MVLSALLGVVLGALARGLVAVVTCRRQGQQASVIELDLDEETLQEIDREAVAADFAAHASAVRRQVSEYADVLAGDDPELRERLRRFETGAPS
ncbi:hypothetical protein K8Z61_16380 [Nocardioides sp. TRM66260-LWL]|uniref:hypothetical protein n=1 Tax=Nocardioides sp. TRM66260-LWL TaxID=2874478 RepID=UPI001CC539E9|nr:hypothetical protein [Nocardioides sp. TRM66260-LWL]MBZ5736073.1 hypothetical protein [Nocardioides sp. TRM66260-LWL]